MGYPGQRALTTYGNRDLLSTGCWGIKDDQMFFNCWIQRGAVDELWNHNGKRRISHNLSTGMRNLLVAGGSVLHSYCGALRREEGEDPASSLSAQVSDRKP